MEGPPKPSNSGIFVSTNGYSRAFLDELFTQFLVSFDSTVEPIIVDQDFEKAGLDDTRVKIDQPQGSHLP